MRKKRILCFMCHFSDGFSVISTRMVPLSHRAPRDPPARFICFLILIFGFIRIPFLTSPVLALTPDPKNVRAVTQYLVRAWTPLQGLPQSSIHDIIQDPHGYLWLTTQNGLLRFDGISFSMIPVSPDPEERSLFFTALTLDSRGRLWAGTYGHGVYFQNHDGWHHFEVNESLKFAIVNVLRFDHHGTLWIGTQNHGIYRVDIHRYQVLHAGNKEHGLTNLDVRTILERKNGEVFIGTSQGIFRFTGAGWRLHPLSRRLPSNYVNVLYEDPLQRLWIGLDRGLFIYDDHNLRAIQFHDLHPDVRTLLMDTFGNLWIGTAGNGLWRYHPDGRLEHLPASTGFSGTTVISLLIDRENNLWAGTLDGGLNRLSSTFVTSISTLEHLASDYALSVFEDSSGRIWLGTDRGTQFWDGHTLHTIHLPTDVPNPSTLSFTENPPGTIWIGTNDGIYIWNPHHVKRGPRLPDNRIRVLLATRKGVWVGTNGGVFLISPSNYRILGQWTAENGLASQQIHTLASHGGQIWIGTSGGGAYQLNPVNGELKPLFNTAPLNQSVVLAFYFDDTGVWIGTFGLGLLHMNGKRIVRFDRSDGLPDDGIFTILPDASGYLWMNSNRGIFRVKKADLLTHARNRSRHLRIRLLGTADGLRNPEGNGGNQPAGLRDHRGNLWFPTMGGFAVIQPESVEKTRDRQIPVIIEKVTVNDRPIRLSNEKSLVIGPGVHRLSIKFTGIFLTDPENVLYRYRLEGFENNWTRPTRTNRVVYSNLPPGHYRFVVQATTGSSERFPSQTILKMWIKPYWYEQPLYRFGLTFLFIFFIALAVRQRFQRSKRHQARLEQLVRERTRALQDALNELEAANRHLEALSYMDGLTGVPNRRYFEEMFLREWNRAQRLNLTLALLIIDVDRFKRFNDTYGHLAGDDCLKQIARTIQHTLRRGTDVVARYGGDEFVVMLPDVDLKGAWTVAHALKKAIEQLAIPHEASDVAPIVTVSIGGIVVPGGGVPSRDRILENADAALYTAKHTGRNRIEIQTLGHRDEPDS